jgi:hypothetical protein
VFWGFFVFSSEVFLLSLLNFGGLSFEPLTFWGCLFFIEGLSFEPMSEGCGNTPSIVALAYLA